MKVITCYKSVADEQDIGINRADDSLDFSRAGSKISQYDLNAIEAAVLLKAQDPACHIMALSVGGNALNDVKGRKDVLSRGADELVLVIDEQFEQALPQQTATALAAAARRQGFDLILCGEGSADLYAQQVGLLLGEALGIPALNGIKKILSLNADAVVVERELEDESEILTVSLPAVLCVTSDSNVPPIPAMKAILSAGKKPVQVWTAADIGVTAGAVLSRQRIAVEKQQSRLGVLIEGDGEEQVAAFAGHLRNIIQ